MLNLYRRFKQDFNSMYPLLTELELKSCDSLLKDQHHTLNISPLPIFDVFLRYESYLKLGTRRFFWLYTDIYECGAEPDQSYTLRMAKRTLMVYSWPYLYSGYERTKKRFQALLRLHDASFKGRGSVEYPHANINFMFKLRRVPTEGMMKRFEQNMLMALILMYGRYGLKFCFGKTHGEEYITLKAFDLAAYKNLSLVRPESKPITDEFGDVTMGYTGRYVIKHGVDQNENGLIAHLDYVVDFQFRVRDPRDCFDEYPDELPVPSALFSSKNSLLKPKIDYDGILLSDCKGLSFIKFVYCVVRYCEIMEFDRCKQFMVDKLAEKKILFVQKDYENNMHFHGSYMDFTKRRWQRCEHYVDWDHLEHQVSSSSLE